MKLITQFGFTKKVDNIMAASELWMSEHNAYLRFFGIKSNPFPLVPDTRHFFFSAQSRKIVNEILHGIHVRKGFLMLTGEVGLGKTTIVHFILKKLSAQETETSLVFNTYENDKEFIDKVLKDFNIEFSTHSLAEKIDLLHEFLLKQNLCGKNCVIFVDDAQNLSFENIEILRMISNLETASQKLVQIVLVGQPELKEKFDLKQFRQLKSRIMIDIEMQPLSSADLKRYLICKSSLHKKRLVFSDDAFGIVNSLTKGNMRKVNKLLDRCLYAAIISNTFIINGRVLLMAAKELKLKSISCFFYEHRKMMFCVPSLACVLFAVYSTVGF